MERYCIAYAADNNYAMPLGVSLYSLFKNNPGLLLTVYILSDNISDEEKEKYRSMAEKFSQEIVIIEIPDIEKMASTRLKTGTWSKCAYARLFLTELLPEDVNTVLWIDGDTLINGSLKELLETDISLYAAGGVLDFYNDAKLLEGFRKKEKYFNSGVLLINLDCWRRENTCRAFIDFIKYVDSNLFFVDQSVINNVLENKILTLRPKWNLIMPMKNYNEEDRIFKFSKGEFYSIEELDEAYREPAVYHYIYCKPWFNNVSGGAVDKWREYLHDSLWNNYAIREKKPYSGRFKWLTPKAKRMITVIMCRNSAIRKIYIKIRYGFWVRKRKDYVKYSKK